MAIVNFDGTKYAEGCVLSEREHNGYDDSDFYATYWDRKEEKVKTVMFATTRGGCGAAYATSVDATDEIIELAAVYRKEQNRRRAVRQTWERRQKNVYLAILLQLTRSQIIKLRAAYPDVNKVVSGGGAAFSYPVDSVEFVACIKLLETRKNDRFRSDFRRSMANQIHDWLTTDSKYKTPLSPRQIEYAPTRDQYLFYPKVA